MDPGQPPGVRGGSRWPSRYVRRAAVGAPDRPERTEDGVVDLLPGPAAARGHALPGRHPHQRRRRQCRHLPQDARAPTRRRPHLRDRVGREPGHHAAGPRPHGPGPGGRRGDREPGHGRSSVRGRAVPRTREPRGGERAQGGTGPGRGRRHGDVHTRAATSATRSPTSCSSIPRATTSAPRTIAPSCRSARASTGSSCWSWPWRRTWTSSRRRRSRSGRC